jgi:hypothetical protein
MTEYTPERSLKDDFPLKKKTPPSNFIDFNPGQTLQEKVLEEFRDKFAPYGVIADDIEDVVLLLEYFIADKLEVGYLAGMEEERTRIRKLVEGMKFPSVEGGSKEMPYTEYPTAKPAHESNEIMMQHFYNQALSDLLQKLEENV